MTIGSRRSTRPPSRNRDSWEVLRDRSIKGSRDRSDGQWWTTLCGLTINGSVQAVGYWVGGEDDVVNGITGHTTESTCAVKLEDRDGAKRGQTYDKDGQKPIGRTASSCGESMKIKVV